jgi:hypothetical protein
MSAADTAVRAVITDPQLEAKIRDRIADSTRMSVPHGDDDNVKAA